MRAELRWVENEVTRVFSLGSASTLSGFVYQRTRSLSAIEIYGRVETLENFIKPSVAILRIDGEPIENGSYYHDTMHLTWPPRLRAKSEFLWPVCTYTPINHQERQIFHKCVKMAQYDKNSKNITYNFVIENGNAIKNRKILHLIL